MKKYAVKGMSCAACSARVERAVSALDGVKSCSVNLLTNSMTVEGSDEETVIKAVRAVGYDASPLDEKKAASKEGTDEGKLEIRVLIKRLASSIALLLLLMYVSMGHVMWGFPLPAALAKNAIAIALIELLLSALVMVINQKFYINGFRGLIKGAPNMDTLVAIGSLSSFLWSVFIVFKMSFAIGSENIHHYLHELYFESAAMIVALITLGKLLESIAKGKTTSAIKSLMELTPKEARVLRDGVEISIPSSEVVIGDIFTVRPGESFAVDGEVVKGDGASDESSLTGESVPVEKSVGSRVFQGTVNISGYLECRAVRVGEDTLMGEVIKTVEEAAASKAPIAKVADRVAGIFVPAVMSIALITAIIWFFVNNSLGYALARGISVLVISCPCALGLATPVAIMVASGIGARGGVLFKTAASLEMAGRAKIIALDKTGTVTEGRAEVSAVVPFGISEKELISFAASLEYKSEHPLARAVVSYAEKNCAEIYESESFASLVGHGVKAVVNGEEMYGGSYKFISGTAFVPEEVKASVERLSSEGKTAMLFTRGDRIIGVIAVEDTVREDSKEVISELHRLGMRTVMITGDNEACAKAIADKVGISEFYAGVLPGEKAARVKELSEDGRVIMVGDGINDSPALTAADVGIAIGNGTDIAIESADAVLMHGGLSGVLGAVKLGICALRNIKENLFWAFFYNAIGIPLAAGVFIPILNWELEPMFGALAMSLSSFSVVMNALRLYTKRIFKREELKNKNKITEKDGEREEKDKMIKLNVKGMMCPHCEKRVKETLEAIAGVKSAAVNFKTGEALVEAAASVSAEELAEAVVKAGYECNIDA